MNMMDVQLEAEPRPDQDPTSTRLCSTHLPTWLGTSRADCQHWKIKDIRTQRRKWHCQTGNDNELKMRPRRWGMKRRGRLACASVPRLSATDTIDAKAAIVPVVRNRKNCEVPHIQAAETSAKVRCGAPEQSAVFSSSNWLHHRPLLLAVECHPMNRNYKDFEIEPFELGRGLWHARFRRADRQPVVINGVLFSTLNAGLAWPNPDAAVDDAKAAIDRLTNSIVGTGSNPAQA
jgi:hypothetical protein